MPVFCLSGGIDDFRPWKDVVGAVVIKDLAGIDTFEDEATVAIVSFFFHNESRMHDF